MKRIFTAFLLNLFFSVFELIGGLLTGSTAILSDAFHDLSDAVSIGISWLFERKSRKMPDEQYTYGYRRFSVLGGLITTLVLLIGSGLVMANAVRKLMTPTQIHYDGMILLAVMGTAVNLAAAWLTREADSVNEKAVNLHMLEDVLGWIVVLVGAVVMKFTDLWFLDPLLSIAVAGFILYHAAGNVKQVLDIFLEKTPAGLSVARVKAAVSQVSGVEDVHHIHLWSMDGQAGYATMHIVTDSPAQVKEQVRHLLAEQGILHTTLETEAAGEPCHHKSCDIPENSTCCKHHHHHHH